jgi:hypothetical protein
MRTIGLRTVIVLVALAAVASPLHAEERPWCTEFDAFTKTCDYASYSQCAEVAKSVGATCVRNGRYRPAPEKSSQRDVPVKRH